MSEKASAEGITELAATGKVMFFIENIYAEQNKMASARPDSFLSTTISPPPTKTISAEVASWYYKKQQQLTKNHEAQLKIWQKDYGLNLGSRFKGLKSAIDLIVDKELLSKLQSGPFTSFAKNVGYCYLEKNPFAIRRYAEGLIEKYHEAKKETVDEIVDASIDLSKGLLNSHLWVDGNGRICAHHLINLLLIQNGLCPALLHNNCFDAFTKEELKTRIKAGMILFKAHCGVKDKSSLHFIKKEMDTTKVDCLSLALFHQDIPRVDDLLKKRTEIIKFHLYLLASSLKFDFTDLLLAIHEGRLRLKKEDKEIKERDEISDKVEMLYLLLIWGVDCANEHLLMQLLAFLLNYHDESNRYRHIIWSNLSTLIQFGNSKIFSLIEKRFIKTYELLDPAAKLPVFIKLALSSDLDLSKRLFDIMKSDINSQLVFLPDCLSPLVLFFKYQNIDLIMRLISLKNVSVFVEMYQNKILAAIHNRVDLNLSDKKKILKQANIPYNFIATDFSKDFEPVELGRDFSPLTHHFSP